MKTAVIVSLLGAFLAVPALGQPAVIDLKAKPRPFAQAEYDALLKCSLAKHPDMTRRYAAYHLLRRDKQTWQENEADADSKLLMPAMEGCITFANGEQIPFSLDRLIADWGRAHHISAPVTPPAPLKFRNYEAEAAACLWRASPKQAKIALEASDRPRLLKAFAKVGDACRFHPVTHNIEKTRAALRAAQPTSAKD